MLEANKGLVREYFAAIAASDLARVRAMMAPGLRFWVSGGVEGDVVFESPDELIEDIERSLTDLYDPAVGLAPEILSLTAEDERVVAEVRIRSKSVNTDERYDNWYVFSFRIADGKFYEIREYLDTDYVRHKLLVPAGIASAIEIPWLRKRD